MAVSMWEKFQKIRKSAQINIDTRAETKKVQKSSRRTHAIEPRELCQGGDPRVETTFSFSNAAFETYNQLILMLPHKRKDRKARC
jgi:hypothetical protein